MANFYVGEVLFETGGTIATPGDINVTAICDCTGSLGTAGQLLSSTSTALLWTTAGSAGIPCSILTAKGDIVVATGASTPTALPVGTNGQVLYANSACSTGLCWGTAGGGGGTVTSITAGTGLTGGTITTSGTVALDTACVIQPTVLTAKGGLISASAASTPSVLAVGTDGQVLTACAACTTGLTWAAGGGGGGSPATPTALGTLYGCSDPDTFCNTALGYNALLAGGVVGDVAIGNGASECSSFGSYNTAVGYHSQRLGDGSRNTSVGTYALCQASLEANIAIGSGAGCDLVAGRYNVIIGTEVQTSSPSSQCELAIGYSTNKLWLSGNCTQAIKPAAGLIDSTNSCGTIGQVLTSTGSNALQWATPQTSPFITYTTSAVSYTTGTPLLVAKWFDGTMQGSVTLDLSGYGGINQLWDIYLSGQSTNYNTGWYQTASYPASSSDPISQGTWYVDFPVYPDPDANVWMIYFSPSQNSLNPSTFTFFYRLLPGSSTPAFQI
jgi:hypothetical protein